MSERELYRMTHPCTGHCLIWIYCYNELMSWSRNLKVMADLVPDFVPQHRPLMSFLIRRPESLCFNSWYTWEDKPWDAKSEKWNDWFKRNPPYGTLKRIIHLTHSHIHLRCMWTTSKSSTPRIGGGCSQIFSSHKNLPSLSTLSSSSEAYPYLRSSSIIPARNIYDIWRFQVAIVNNR